MNRILMNALAVVALYCAPFMVVETRATSISPSTVAEKGIGPAPGVGADADIDGGVTFTVAPDPVFVPNGITSGPAARRGGALARNLGDVWAPEDSRELRVIASELVDHGIAAGANSTITLDHDGDWPVARNVADCYAGQDCATMTRILPAPAALWFLVSGVVGLIGYGVVRRNNSAT